MALKMLNLVGDVVKYFSFDDVNVDNWVFKLFYKGAFIILLVGSMVGITSQYFGEPINCDFKGIDSEMASDYCWIHGSSYIPPEYQQSMKCIVDQDGIESADDAPDTSYYQVPSLFTILSRNLSLSNFDHSPFSHIRSVLFTFYTDNIDFASLPATLCLL